MNLPELIENLHLDLSDLNPRVVNKEIIANYSDRDFVKLIEIFLRGIGSRHEVPGKVIYTLQGISGDYQEHENLTNEQKTYAIGRIPYQ